ncbi:NAD-dependent epimerase/dehydratase family protein [Jeotgalibacillus haloalkalitolerans]|uniref:NAD-dependent epimerase/dehydratase family protein n=1 Tax=Jeotgalibacillus haloalkalitolerans TaxID=3104292 RepID=A0ABU5KPK4_9BACL|nr:NAD-dependent epimerase/dehydratase family protein [Jeotgalibacillus sp. HH7-29]MDZ5713182.1 NAD-dependent epimerase/dehydratase family protein [Jeotgalibacillus sp. HH7-29]
MKLLILGGTKFLGRHIAESAVNKGHEVTLFNRGQTNTSLFPDAEKLTGDRNGDLSALKNGTWDAVIDVSGYTPSQVRKTAELLRGRVNHYTLISTISVYEDYTNGPAVEGVTKLAELKEDTEEVNGATYGPLKQQCEEVVKEQYGDRSLIIRPGLIVGPHDPTDRFTYWVWRAQKGGEALAPGKPERKVQWIDVRDLSEWTIQMIENKKSGTFNAAGGDPLPTMEKYLETAKKVANSDVRYQWVSDEVLTEHEAGPFVEVPFWLPVSEHHPDGFLLADASKAISKGLTFRPLEETISDTLLWLNERKNHEWQAGLTEERERKLLNKN